jgi:hypothetical protein
MSSPKPIDVKLPEDPTRWPSPRPFPTDDERYTRGQNQNGGDAGSQVDKGDDLDADRGEKLVKVLRSSSLLVICRSSLPLLGPVAN